MILQNKYVFGCLVQFYEIEMVSEHIDSCIQMLDGIENPENVTFQFVFNKQQYLERIDPNVHGSFGNLTQSKFLDQIDRLASIGANVTFKTKRNDDPFYNIARFRRDLIYKNCEDFDFIMFSETDSLWPKRTLWIIEHLWSQVNTFAPKFLLTFAYRLNWDSSWKKLVHPMFDRVSYIDDDDFVLNDEASEKAYMTLERMNEINESVPFEAIEIMAYPDPKADGSCLVMSADLAMSIGGMPHALLHCGEDEAIVRQCKLLMGDNMVQYHVRNQLRVHNRRHPRKRVGVLNEDNPQGFCTQNHKGEWWKIIEDASKYNLENLRMQSKFIRMKDVLKQINR